VATGRNARSSATLKNPLLRIGIQKTEGKKDRDKEPAIIAYPIRKVLGLLQLVETTSSDGERSAPRYAGDFPR
jgi:hypothetical protein